MKLSDFLQPKKLSYIGDELILENPYIDYGSIEFYELTLDKLAKIEKAVVKKIKTDDDVVKFLFDIWEHVTNIEKDITYTKFKKMIEFPDVDFMPICKSVIKIINNLFKLVNEQENIKKESELVQQKYPDLFPKQETLEEKIVRLNKEMDEEKDFKKKKAIFEELSKLYEQLEGNQNG